MIVAMVRCARIKVMSDLLRHELAQQTAWSNKQDANKDGESDAVSQVGVDRRRKCLRDAHNVCAEYGARDVADAAKNRGDERFQARPYAQERGCQHAIGRAVQDAAGACQRRTHDEGRTDDDVDVDAHEAGCRFVECHGAHLLADEGLVDKPEQQDHQEEGNADVEQQYVGDGEAEVAWDGNVLGHDEVRELAELWAEDEVYPEEVEVHRAEVLQEYRNTERGDQCRKTG